MAPSPKPEEKTSFFRSLFPFYPSTLYLGFSFLAFAPCLLTGKAYFLIDLLYYNGPVRTFLRNQLVHGHFPLWNPYLYCGQPFFADPNTMMAYPLNYLTLLFPIPYGLTVFFFLHMFLAAAGMGFWLKSLGLAEKDVPIGGLLYALSGFFWVELNHPQALAAFAWIPWWFGSLERLSKDLAPRRALMAGLAFALLFLTGFFQMILGGGYGGLLYFLFRAKPGNLGERSWKKLFSSPSFRRKLALALLFMAWGASPLLLQLIPTAEFVHLSNRASPQAHYEDFNALFSLQPRSLYQFLFPAMGLPPGEDLEAAFQHMRGTQDMDFLGNAGYLGVWVPLLALLALRRREKAPVLSLAALGSLFLLLSLGKYFFLHRLFCWLVPGFDLLRSSYRFLHLYVLCAAALAVFGFRELGPILTNRRKNPFLFKAVLLYGILGCLVPMLDWRHWGQGPWRESLGAALGLAGMGLWTGPWAGKGRLFFQGALVLPLLFYGWGCWTAAEPGNYDFKENSVVSRLPPLALGRVVVSPAVPYFLKINGQGYSTNFPPEAMAALGIRTTDGYNPLMLQRTRELLDLPFSSQRRLMGVGEILWEKPRPGTEGMREEVYGQFHLYRSSPDYLFAPGRVEVVPSPRGQWERLRDPSFDPREGSFLEAPLPAEISAQLTGRPGHLNYQLVRDEPDTQSFRVGLDIPSLVVFSEIQYPGWRAFVDGKTVPIHTANLAFRSLFLPAGVHQVEFRFEPGWVPLLWGLVAIWTLSAILYLTLSLISRRKPILAPSSSAQPRTNV